MRKNRTLNVLIVCALIFIWGNSLLPGEISGAVSDRLMEHMNAAAAGLGLRDDAFTYMYDQDGDGVEEPTSHIVRKMAHVTEFAVLGALLFLRLESRGRRRAVTAFLLGAAAGAADEILQRFTGRGSMLQDVFIDCGGVALGLLLAAAGGENPGRAAPRASAPMIPGPSESKPPRGGSRFQGRAAREERRSRTGNGRRFSAGVYLPVRISHSISSCMVSA